MPWVLLGSSEVGGFSRARSEGCWVHPSSLGSLARALGVVVLLRVRWVHSHAPLGSMGSSGVVAFTSANPGSGWVRPGSMGSLGCALGVVRFIRGPSGPSGAPWESGGSC